MGFLLVRISAVSTYLVERAKHGIPETTGVDGGDLLVVLDGVGGLQFAPLMVRRALRREDQERYQPSAADPSRVTCFRWQWGLPGEIYTDLCWLRRNRVMGAKLARQLLAYRREHPDARIHLLAYSGGAGIGVFACEALKDRQIIETLVLACPAMSIEYNLAPALRAVKRCYNLASHKDKWVLGLGTRIFGTTDRRFSASGGMSGFRIPADASEADRESYQRMREIHWDDTLLAEGHPGGHTSWATTRFLSRHLTPILNGQPLLAATPVQAA
jgi:pimeloyl-ACP methyl ester carboxylesterase